MNSILKKVLSFLLASIMIFSSGAVAVFAKDTNKKAETKITLSENAFANFSKEELELYIKDFVAVLIGAKSPGEIVIDKKLMAEIQKVLKTTSVGDLIGLLGNYVFIKRSSLKKAGPKADRILKDSKFGVSKLSDGRETVYIIVDLKKHPELRDYAVFRETVKRLYKQQLKIEAKERKKGNYFSGMTYEHIAGELFLHMLMYYVSDSLGGANPENKLMNKFYNMAEEVYLNFDEKRFPRGLMLYLGYCLMAIDKICNNFTYSV